MRAKVFAVGVVVGVLLSSAVMVLAGNLDPPSGPTDAASQMVTLEQIFQRLYDGTTGTKMASFTEPASAPGTGTMHTLDDIMAAAPVPDNSAGALPAEVLNGKTYWGLRTDGTWGPQMGTATYLPAPVPKTGQTLSYGERDDGELEMGVPWPAPRFVTSTTGLVTDTLTGLVWLQDANCIMSEYPDFDQDATAQDGMVTWEHALLFVAGINAGTYPNCGGPFTDWRLPNVRELHSLIDYGSGGPALPGSYDTYFTGVQWNVYWSGTTQATFTSYAWVINLSDGFVGYDDKTAADYVWPVRGGP
jgi:hypothetical protein